ncbi:MAG TPA: reverse transcriptase domain-containing protein [Saprospiraceae bacterium]|nr:reverse transcriptase domain-containing protein [Saprospiraceae bacterium]
MNISEEIKTRFEKMQTKDDLLDLLNFVRPEVFLDVPFSFTMEQLNKNISYQSQDTNGLSPESNPLVALIEKFGAKVYGGRYKTFQIRKKSGSLRTIHAPNSGLKAILKCINYIFQAIHTPHKNAFGFVPNKSIVDNARKHEDQNYVYNLDLKDFFPSVDQARVRGRLLVAPFQLDSSPERIKLASILAILCCHKMDVERWDETTQTWETKRLNVLPQGAPTSPTITNMICERLDIRLTKLAKEHNCKYSRYADDITFSSMHNVYQKDGTFITKINDIITSERFHIQQTKTRLQKRGYRQEVTGLIVNEKVNVDTRYIKELRHWLYLWERYGYDKATALFSVKYLQSKGHVKQGKPKIENVIWGKLEYLKMVKGYNNPLYIKLKERYEQLMSQNIDDILDVWEKEGIEKAMVLYYQNNKPKVL